MTAEHNIGLVSATQAFQEVRPTISLEEVEQLLEYIGLDEISPESLKEYATSNAKQAKVELDGYRDYPEVKALAVALFLMDKLGIPTDSVPNLKDILGSLPEQGAAIDQMLQEAKEWQDEEEHSTT